MSTTTELEVLGLADVLRMLDALPAKIAGNILRSGLNAGARVIANEARRLVPVKTGTLRGSIRVATGIKNGRVVAIVKAGGSYMGGRGKNRSMRDAFYAHFVEFGTAAHFIKGPIKLKGRVLQKINHPGARKKPFMRPALDNKSRDAIEAMAAHIRRRIESGELVGRRGRRAR